MEANMDSERTLKLPRAEELREFICYWPDDDDDDADDDADDDYDENGEDGAVSSRREQGPCRPT
jgi:hypothetical protein